MGYELWWFSAEIVGFPQFSAPLAAKLYVRLPKVLEVQKFARDPL